MKCDLHVVVSSSADSTIRVWDYTGHCRSILEGHIGVVRCLCLHGDRLVSGGDRKRVVVWDIKVHIMYMYMGVYIVQIIVILQVYSIMCTYMYVHDIVHVYMH